MAERTGYRAYCVRAPSSLLGKNICIRFCLRGSFAEPTVRTLPQIAKTLPGGRIFAMAERTGFEPARDLRPNTLSRRAP